MDQLYSVISSTLQRFEYSVRKNKSSYGSKTKIGLSTTYEVSIIQ